MFKLLRSRAKFFYWIIAITFILFTFIVWGAQCNRSGPAQQQGPTWIGSVNGVKISTSEWDAVYRQYLDQLRNQYRTDRLSVNQTAMAAETVWNQLVQLKIIDQEIARRGLEVSDDDIVDTLKNDPPAILLQSFTDEDGNVDMDAYYRELSNPERDWSSIEAYLRQSMPQQRLMDEVTSSVTIDDEEIKREYRDRTARAMAEYVGALYADITVEDDPTEAEVAAYYAEHTDEFFQPEKAVVALVTFPKEPSEIDHADVRELAVEVRQEILDGTLDFEEAAAIYSEDGTGADGGDLGTFDRERMVAPFTEAAFTLPVGEVGMPVETQFGYHLIEVLEQIAEGDSIGQVHARHILFKVTPGDSTLTDLYERAKEFAKDAKEIGFSEAAEDAALEVAHPRPVQQGRDIPGFRNTIEGNLFAFNSTAGDVSRVFETDDFFYVVENVDYLPEGPSPLEDVESQVVAKVKRERKTELAGEKIAPAVEALKTGRDFAGVAEEFGLAHAVTDTFTATGNVANVGYNTDFNTAALDAEIGELVESVETTRGIFALKTLWKSDFDETDYASQYPQIRAALEQQHMSEAWTEWYEEQLAAAKIDDRRYLLYQR